MLGRKHALNHKEHYIFQSYSEYKPGTLTLSHILHLLLSFFNYITYFYVQHIKHFYIKINYLSSVIIKYISVFDLSPF